MAPSPSPSPSPATAGPATTSTSHTAHPPLLSRPALPPSSLSQSQILEPPSPAPPLRSPAVPTLAFDDSTARRIAKKLQKKRRDGEHTPTMELPERLQDHGDPADNEEEDLKPQYQGGMFMNMNQSVFGMLAAAGSQVDFDNAQSSDEDDHDGEAAMAMTIAGHRPTPPRRGPSDGVGGGPLAQTTILRKPASVVKSEGRHRRKLSETRLLSGLKRLSSRSRSAKSPKGKGVAENQLQEDQEEDTTTGSPSVPLMPPSVQVRSEGSRHAPVMSRMLEARAEMAARPSFDLGRLSSEQGRVAETGEAGPTELAKRLKDIFEFEQPEEVIEEYPCWLLQHVLLQGYMYITTRHIAFYAYLPKKANEVAKSGYLGKSGKRNPKFNRYWFRLKGDVLSYYRDPQDLYFPSGTIDLRYGISASVTDKDKENIHFAVTTHQRTYNFKADSVQSAREWVKALQRVIFRSHNEGDSVKISLPIENVIDIEETQMLDFADTCKIRVIDNDETYAIDEYFFSFFSYGKEALNVLKILIEDNSDQTPASKDLPLVREGETLAPSAFSSKRTSVSGPLHVRTSKLAEGVRATLSPLSPSPHSPSPRASVDFSRSSFDALRPFGRRSLDINQLAGLHQESPRRSFSGSRRSVSRNRLNDHTDRDKQDSSESYVQSLEDPSQASISALVASGSSEDQSASQILRGSDVFHSPTIRRSASATRVPRPENSPRPRIGRYQTADPGKITSRPSAFTGQATDSSGVDHDLDATTPTLQSIAKMGGYPLQRANAFMGYLDRTSRRMSSLLATESMGYVEKVSGMWRGGKKHYDEPDGLRTDDEEMEADPDERANHEARFKEHFALPESEKLQAAYFGHIIRVLPLYGKIYIGDRHFCFRSLLPGTRTKLVLPIKDIENVNKEKGFRFGYAGLVVVIRGHEELFFEFPREETRDDCTITLLQNVEANRYLRGSSLLDREEALNAQAAAAERDALQQARNEEFPEHQIQLPRQASEAPTILFDDPNTSFLNFKPKESLRVTCLTIGSRGDVQPYIALCKKLLQEGHRPRIATHAEFKDWVEGHGIEFACIGGDPSELMRICIQNGTFTWAFLREANSKFRGWLDDLLASAWDACQGSDLLIESPSAMAGIHIAEALGIPYFRAFTMPWTRTRAYPHAFIMPGQKMGGAYNYLTYVMFDNVFWKAMAHQVNRWRNNMLKLPNTNLEKLQLNKVPFLYNFSPYVVPPPLDYSDWIRVTGYWFLDEGNDKWTPPADLVAFIDKARRDEKKLVYVGFGSIIVPDPVKMTQEVIDAVLKADVRCILSKGWSDRVEEEVGAQQTGGIEKPEPVLPPEIFQIKSAPHDWLFQQIDAAAHHGGSGTTGASLRAGIPTIIRPFFGDQFFFGTRVEDLGVGICLKKWGANSFARALWEATHSQRMIVKARVLGEQIRKENGVDTAVQCIYRDMEYATNLIRSKAGKNHARRDSAAAGGAGADADGFEDDEESWTFVGADAESQDDLSPENVVKRTAADFRVASTTTPTRALGSRVLGTPGSGGSKPN